MLILTIAKSAAGFIAAPYIKVSKLDSRLNEHIDRSAEAHHAMSQKLDIVEARIIELLTGIGTIKGEIGEVRGELKGMLAIMKNGRFPKQRSADRSASNVRRSSNKPNTQ